MISSNANSENRKGNNFTSGKAHSNVLEEFKMQDCKPSKAPAENNLKLEVAHEDSVRLDSHEFGIVVVSFTIPG